MTRQQERWQMFVDWLEEQTAWHRKLYAHARLSFRLRWFREMRNITDVTRWLCESDYGARLHPIFSHYVLKASLFPHHAENGDFLGFAHPMLTVEARNNGFELEYRASRSGDCARQRCGAWRIRRVLKMWLARLERDSQELGASYR